MGKHHRKWYIDEEIASNKRVQEMMDDLESKPMGKATELHEYLSKAIKVKESYMNVNVSLCEDGTLYIDDAETDEQLTVFKVIED